MKKDKNVPAQPDKGTILSQKTYEDFNQKRPTPNEIKKPPTLPDVPPNPNDAPQQNQTDHNQGENKSEGSE